MLRLLNDDMLRPLVSLVFLKDFDTLTRGSDATIEQMIRTARLAVSSNLTDWRCAADICHPRAA